MMQPGTGSRDPKKEQDSCSMMLRLSVDGPQTLLSPGTLQGFLIFRQGKAEQYDGERTEQGDGGMWF